MALKGELKEYLPYILLVGGAYFAYRSWNPTHRNLGLLAAGAGVGMIVDKHARV